MQLQQSPFLDIFPAQRVRATLQLMSSPDERVTRERAREICRARGEGFHSRNDRKFDRNHSIALKLSMAKRAMGWPWSEAEGKDQVLKALSRAASELRSLEKS